jgi:hypothetical protein
MEKLLSMLAKIPADKQGHALIGALIFVLASFVLLLFLPMPLVPPQALLIVVVIGALKEIYDAYHPDMHTCDVWDWVATVAGGMLVYIAVQLHMSYSI